MEISEALRWTADNLPRGSPRRRPSPLGGLLRSAADLTPLAVSKAPQLIKDAVADPDSRERIGRTAWGLADLVLAEASKPFTGGLSVYRVVKEGWTKCAPLLNEGDKKLRQRLESIEARLTRMEAEGLWRSRKISFCCRRDPKVVGVQSSKS